MPVKKIAELTPCQHQLMTSLCETVGWVAISLGTAWLERHYKAGYGKESRFDQESGGGSNGIKNEGVL
jgi:hypothetical protein